MLGITKMANLRKALNDHHLIAQRIRAEFPDASDEDLRDTILGEGYLDDAIAATLRQAVEADEMAKALGGMIKLSQERKRRLEARADKLKAIALQAAEEAGLRSIPAPDFTAVVMHGKQAVVIPDDDAVPDDFVEVKRYPKKGLIGDSLRAGANLAWASLGNASSYWMIRRG
jgi:hypothetical protein